MTLLDRLAKGTAKTAADLARGNTRLGKLLQRDGVPHSEDLKRVLALPRRQWEDSSGELVELMTEHLRTPNGTQTLHAPQAALLAELVDCGGAFGELKVGVGKTLVAYLAPVVTEIDNVVLLTTGSLISSGEVERHFTKLSKNWRGHMPILVSYQELGLEKNEHLLTKLAPKLVMADEGYLLKNLDAGVSRRVERYFAEHDDARFLVMAGTICQGRAIMDYHHLMRWALVDKMPLPMEAKDAKLWGRALDHNVPIGNKMELGALKTFGKTVEDARVGFMRRLCETPGVVITRDVEVRASIQIKVYNPWQAPSASIAARNRAPHPCAREIFDAWNGKAPNGDVLEDDDKPKTVAQLSVGFFYHPKDPIPQEWRERRRKWHQFERFIRDQRKPGLDTELQVRLACRRGDFGKIDAYDRWIEIEPTYKIVNVPCWVSYDVIDKARELAGDDTLIWTLYGAPGDALAERHGLRYFRHQACDEFGNSVMTGDGKTCVVSMAACGTGLNLQELWHKSFLLTPPGSLEMCEQVFGRTHRQGQEADLVEFSFLAASSLYAKTIDTLREDAENKKRSNLSRLALADWV